MGNHRSTLEKTGKQNNMIGQPPSIQSSTYGAEKQVVIWASSKQEENWLTTVLDGKGAAQPAVVAPGRIGADETRLEDFDIVRLDAQHDDFVQSAWLESVVQFDADTPRSSSTRLVSCDPGIDQLVLVDKRVIVGVDCVEVACDNAAAASGLAQEASQYVHLEHTSELRVEGVEVDVEET